MLEFLDSNQLLIMNLVQNVRLELFKKVFFFFNLMIPSAKQQKKKTTTTKPAVYLKV